MKRKIPRIYCAQCGYHVDAIRVEEDLRTRQAVILVECHGQVEVMTMDGYQFLEVMRSGIAGTAFENKLEDHSDDQAPNQTGNPQAGIPSEAMALLRLCE